MSDDDVAATQEKLLGELFKAQQIDTYVLWYYSPMAMAFTRLLAHPLAVIYDCMDELSAFRGAPPALQAHEAELFKRADLVFTGGQSLYEAKQDRHPHVYAFPSSVDAAHFRQARAACEDPADQAGIPRPRMSFYGVIDERLDLELLAGVADARPDWHLVMIGPVTKIAPDMLPQRPTIHYLGPRDYADLPAYLAGWDVTWLPFVRNDATRFISPTKTLEYLAAGKPVISTSIHDVIRPYGEDGLVRIADTVADTVAAMTAALQEDAAARLHRVDALLEQTSWDRTWARMTQMIEAAIDTHAVSKHPAASTMISLAPTLAPTGTTPIRSNRAPHVFDYLIVGAGFAGSVLAERLASQAGKKVLIVDKRPHIGGNAYDHYDDAGLLVHPYGPHIFHTNSATSSSISRSSRSGGPISIACWPASTASWCPCRSTWTRSTPCTA